MVQINRIIFPFFFPFRSRPLIGGAGIAGKSAASRYGTFRESRESPNRELKDFPLERIACDVCCLILKPHPAQTVGGVPTHKSMTLSCNGPFMKTSFIKLTEICQWLTHPHTPARTSPHQNRQQATSCPAAGANQPFSTPAGAGSRNRSKGRNDGHASDCPRRRRIA